MKKILMLVLSLALTSGLALAQTKDKDKGKDKDQRAKTTQTAPEGSAKEEAMEKSVHITSGPEVIDLKPTSATLKWTTNKNAANDVHYNCGGKDKIAYHKGGATEHSIALTGLKPGSTCTWKIMTREKEVRKEGTFQTPAK